MNKLVGRLIIFFVGVPAIAVLIIFLPGYAHLGLNAAASAVCVIGTGEMLEMLRRRSIPVEKPFLISLSGIAPVAAYLGVAGIIGGRGMIALFVLPFAAIAVRHTLVFRRTSFEASLPVIAGSFAALVYPGFFAVFFIRIAGLPEPTLAFLAFLAMVFANDTAAYVFGMLLGRSSRGVSPISPNKSIPGFVAGPTFSIGVALLFYLFAPAVFSDRLFIAVSAGIAVGAATIVGDLFESVIKRSAGVKDSGILVPGRGGVLDSVDSVFFAAPVFYLILSSAA